MQRTVEPKTHFPLKSKASEVSIDRSLREVHRGSNFFGFRVDSGRVVSGLSGSIFENFENT